MTKNERRVSRRFKARAGAYVSYIGGSGAIRDISMDGIFILDREPLAVGTVVNLWCNLGAEVAKFQGIVRRSEGVEGMAIQFQEVPREMRRRLLSHMACLTEEMGAKATAMPTQRMPMEPVVAVDCAGRPIAEIGRQRFAA